MNRWTRLALFVVSCGSVLGALAFVSAPQSVFPAIALARVEVFADAGELPSEQVRSEVAAPLEAAFATLPFLSTTRTYADPGKLELELDFDPKSDPNEDLRNVQAALAGVRDRLPVSHLTTLIEGPNMEPVVSYAITSASTAQSELRRRVEGVVVPLFVGTPGLGRLTVFGGPRPAYHVTLDAAKSAALGISPRAVADAIASANRPRAAGSIETSRERLAVISGGALQRAADFAGVRVASARSGVTVPLSAVARVTYGDEPTGEQTSFDATRAVILNAYPIASGDAVALKRSVEQRLTGLRAALPADARIVASWDQTRLILASQEALRDEMLAGALIALLVIFWFLRDRALTLAAAIVLPAALALTVLILVRAGFTLDLMTLGGLAIAIGLIIDEVIVVVEAIASALEGRPPSERRAAIAEAMRRVAKPLIASTASNVVVFLPLAFLSGVPGFFFRALSVTLAVALVVSIVLSLALAPALALTLGARAHAKAPLRGFERGYLACLRWALRHTLVVSGCALLTVAAALWLLFRVPSDFLPSVDEGQFEIKYALPPGTSLAAAESIELALERAVLADRSVLHEARLSGVDTNGLVATPPDAGTIRVTLKPHADSFDRVAARLRWAIGGVDPNAAVEIHQLLEDQINDLSGATEPVQLAVRGPSGPRIAQIASHLADDIDGLPGVVDTFDGVIWQPRIVRAYPRSGETADEFADDLQARVGGITATEIASDGARIPVVVRVADRLPLARRFTLAAPELATTVQEENGVRIVRVTADIENADLSTVMAGIRHNIRYALANLPPGYSIEIGGAAAAQGAAFREFAAIFGLAVVLIFGVLLATFNSFRLPLVVLAAVPLAPIGVALALAATNTSLNVASFMGILLLIGIVVRNGILLVERASARVLEGATPVEAMERSAIERLRPILMTTFATLAALGPLALGLGAGAEMERPLAIAVIGGIVSATLLTLVLIPVLYVGRTRPRAAPARLGNLSSPGYS
ncbi:MAG: efflux RND transporter permease subunit [Candidatus Baltobacteraceae bacterium]